MSSKNITFCRSILYAGYRFTKSTGFLRYLNRNRDEASILLFHRVNDEDDDPMSTPTYIFEDMIKKIKNNYRPISLQELIEKIRQGEKIEHSTVVITFDDGYRDNVTNALPILEKHGVPATFFIASGYVGTNKVFPWDEENRNKFENLTWDDVRYIRRKGFEIGSHTINHVNLGEVSLETARREIRGCKEKIESETGEIVDKFAYPFGRRDKMRVEVIPLIKESGFTCCLSGYGGKVDKNCDLFHLNRIPAYPSTIELSMEIDNFHTFYDDHMSFFGNSVKNDQYAT
jgi:peptidoglycan/xylan/chitin deacetylase (PgdA/CDA1 family)